MKAVWKEIDNVVTSLQFDALDTDLKYYCSHCGGYVSKVQEECPFCHADMVASNNARKKRVKYVK